MAQFVNSYFFLFSVFLYELIQPAEIELLNNADNNI